MTDETTQVFECDKVKSLYTILKMKLGDGEVTVSFLVRGESMRLVEAVHSLCRTGIACMLDSIEESREDSKTDSLSTGGESHRH